MGVNYGISYEDVVKRYESYRASCKKDKEVKKAKGCIMPLDEKAQSYKFASNRDCSIISIELAKQFIDYAFMRGLNENELKFMKCYEKDKQFIKKKYDINCDKWCSRNKECFEIIENMRINSIPSLENDGKWEGLPTKNELKLILRLTSNLSTEELMNISIKLPKNNKSNDKFSMKNRKIYRLVKSSN